MSSDFEKSLARAAADRIALDDAKAAKEREDAEKSKLAHSIIDPYLADLGPKAAKALRQLGVPTDRWYVRWGPKEGEDLGYWEFETAYDSDSGRDFIRVNASGKFELEPSHLVRLVGLVRGNQLEYWNKGLGQFSRLFANLDDRKVYVSRQFNHYAHSFDASQLQELGECLAQAIYSKKKA